MLDYFYQSGIDWIIFLQRWGKGLIVPMQWITFLGKEEFFLVFMPILYWCVDAVLGVEVGVVLLVSASLNLILKLGFHTPRPYWVSTRVHAYDSESPFGIPSGHAMIAASIWGFFAVQRKRLWSWVFFGALIVMIGVSRVFLGVHFPIDVILGWIFGILFLWSFLKLETPVSAWLSRIRTFGRLVVALVAALLLVILGALILALLKDWSIPMSWIENARAAFPDEPPIDPLSLTDLITTSGAFFGLSAGAIWLFARRGYDAGGSLAFRLLRIPLGLAGVLVIWFFLGSIFPDGADLFSYALRFVRYSLVGLWVSALAPATFIRLGLARTGSP